MSLLDFPGNRSRNIPAKRRPSKYAESQIRPNILTSPGIFADRPFPPYKYLPVMFKDVTTEDFVVILKGTIVSCLSNMSSDPKYNFTDEAGLSGKFDLMTPSGCADEGHINIGLGANNVMRTAGVDSSYWGYEDSQAGLLVPCNGGWDSQLVYTTDDVTAQTITVSGTEVTTTNVTNEYTVPLEANFPIGVTYQDVYADIEGKWLNYNLNPKASWGVVFDHVIAIPYVDNYQLIHGEGAHPSWTRNCYVNDQNFDLSWPWQVDGTYTGAHNVYESLRREFAFLYSPIISDYLEEGTLTDETALLYKMLRPGSALVSDRFGKFVLMDCWSTDDIATAELRGPRDALKFYFCAPYHLVGKLVTTDCRFPKSRLDTVDTYPGSGLTGTETGGIDYHLFQFAYTILTACIAANGLTAVPTIENVVDFIQCGTVGMAYINLQVA